MFNGRENSSEVQIPDMLPKSELCSYRPVLEPDRSTGSREGIGGGNDHTGEDDSAKC